MTLQNRVMPDGSILAIADRGTMMGNRGGCFHRDDKSLLPRHWATRQWICCELQFKGRRRRLMQPGRYTELFFLDEATALAAGHRPCFECRRQDALTFARLWPAGKGRDRASAPEMDHVLHGERLDAAGRKRIHLLAFDALTAGAMFQVGPDLFLKARSKYILAWSPAGYSAGKADFPSQVQVLTPPAILAVLAAGYRPRLHDSAQELL